MDPVDFLLRDALDELPVGPGGLEGTLRRVRARRLRRTSVRAAGAAVLTAAIAVAGVSGLLGSTSPASATTVRVPGAIVDATSTTGRFWALSCTKRCHDSEHSRGRLVSVDARTGRTRSTTVVRSPQAVAAGEDSVWTVDFWNGTVTRVSAQTGRPVATIALELPKPVARDDDAFLPFDVAAGAGGVWVSTARGYVARVDPATNRVVAMIRTPDDATGAILAGGGAVWIGEGLSLGRLEPSTDRLSRMTIDGPGDRRLSIGALAFADGSLWISGVWAKPSHDATGHQDYTATDEAVLAEIDPSTGSVLSLSTLPHDTALRSGDGGRLWLVNPRTSELYEFSSRTRSVVASAHVGATQEVVPATGGRVWVTRSAHEFTLVDLERSRR